MQYPLKLMAAHAAAVVLLLAIDALGQPAARDAWLPAQVQEAVVAQMVERLISIGPTRGGTAAELAGATSTVSLMRDALDAWQLAGVLARAPRFSQLDLPSSTNRYLDAMARYQICALGFTIQFENRAAPAPDRRRAAASLTSVTLSVLYLRHPFAAEGGTNANVEAFLTSAAMERVSTSVQSRPELLAHVQGACAPVLEAMLTRGK